MLAHRSARTQRPAPGLQRISNSSWWKSRRARPAADNPRHSAWPNHWYGGRGQVNPFYPAPHRGEGSIAADLVITERRKKRCDKGNLFAIVEIKFPGDRIERPQFDSYEDVLKKGATIKTANATHRFENRPVSSGGRLSLFRYPEDMPATWHKDTEPSKTGRKNK